MSHATPERQPETPLPPPPGADVEGGATPVGTERPPSNFRGLSGLQQWRKEDWMKKGIVVLRGIALLFSFLSFILMVSNIHGSPANFNLYEEYNYVLAIAIIAMVYTAIQTGIKTHELCSGNQIIPPEIALWFDFSADQIMAYLLLSSASAGTPLTDRLHSVKSQFGSQAAASLSMSFLAFFSLAPASLISGLNLSTLLSK